MNQIKSNPNVENRPSSQELAHAIINGKAGNTVNRESILELIARNKSMRKELRHLGMKEAFGTEAWLSQHEVKSKPSNITWTLVSKLAIAVVAILITVTILVQTLGSLGISIIGITLIMLAAVFMLDK